MNSIDFFIIYLAGGAPFGVYYFLKNRTQPDVKLLGLKSFLNFLFWIPLALHLLKQNLLVKSYSADLDRITVSNAERGKRIGALQKEIEGLLIESELEVSIYEFREIVERYVGLTLVAAVDDAEINVEHEKNFYLIAAETNIELAAACLNRRNRQRLLRHQINAREDFLRLVRQILKFGANQAALEHSAVALAETVKDSEAQTGLEKMFAASLQIETRAAVRKLEVDLWKPEIHKPSPVRRISPLPVVNTMAAASLPGKD